MANKYFDIIVKSLMKHMGRLINISKIEQILKRVVDEDFANQKMYKLIYYLKNRGYLYNVKKNVFLVKRPETELTQQHILDMFYRPIVKQHCNEFLKSNRYIGWLKALELNVSSFTIPDELLIVNNYKQSNEIIMFTKQICFKRYGTAKENLFSFFYKFVKKITIGKNVFFVADLELALLESLYNPGLINTGYVTELVKRTIRERKDDLDLTVREKILRRNKHHSSINRLHKIAQSVDPVFVDKIKALIKKVSYFII